MDLTITKNHSSLIRQLKEKLPKLNLNKKLLVLMLQNFSPDSLNNEGIRSLLKYEELYINKLSDYISLKYSITINDESSINEENLRKVSEIHEKILVQTLVSYEPTFSHLKNWVRIDSVEKLNKLNTLLDIYTNPLKEEDMNQEDFLEFILEAPSNLRHNFIKQGLVVGMKNVRFRVFNNEEGVNMLMTVSERDKDYYVKTNMFPLLIK